ncbi:dihydroorotase family protein [Ponticoccus sp. SC2-23]|uniref:dihydroorotase n=1 Tax=Alexandriicola marinus TaxID=2081710 RepID=UPI000FDC1E4E|nr:dihydroorotase family protein [Alexandriicola marinus]MBM1219798.1 dihydroorotase family protein [Ponticoccus sp. SC6-9]MBM1223130.1 dihydroorotase family protein [Ponticoccus sp. SC6-15]MBM1229611.1 dihydroorotase family protein [Ponticoccus sp. SC6-38]MBM1232096.1 dihydroorotase family protein [Ponticoccus sp. SC6-45]MBM1237954.1 dihydroorotase family protein [Ponticoccus sp. SC6-49]MBM1241107.1 dihydroorotase family protein [Ponticoccus sp. SC2-64]MBM1245620.1 dihydroorotase family pro
MTGPLDTLITGGEVLLPDGPCRADLGLADGRVAGVYAPGTGPDAVEVIDAAGKTLLPGIVDIHFHVRAPAYPERGTVQSETRAAAAGGVTTLFEMPISKPCCSTPEELAQRRDHFAQNAFMDFGLYAAPGDLTVASRDAMMALGCIAWKIFTTAPPPGRADEFDGLAFPDEADQLRALTLLAGTGLPVVVHAESAQLLEHFEAEASRLDPADAATHGASRPAVCESVAVAKLLAMNMTAQAKLHIAHVTSAETVDVLRAFAGTSDFTAETCPQYLFTTEEDVARAGVYAKVNPPIRHQADQDALWQAIEDGVINYVTTDHAPFSHAEKQAAEGNFPAAPPGVPGIEFILPAMLDAVARGRLSLGRAHDLVCANGARRYGLFPWKGALLPGSCADVTIVDLTDETALSAETLHTHAREVAHLFEGRRLQGKVCRTIVRGKTVFEDGRITGTAGGGSFVTPRAEK